MIKPILVLISVSLIFFSCQQKPKVKALPEKLDSLMTSVPDFSGVILVADQGKPVWTWRGGYRNVETKDSIQTTDIFELASVSKQFTAAVIMMLKEEGKLSYDDSIDKYLKNIPYPGITIRHLLSHTSGLPDYQAIMDQYWDKTKVAGNEDILQYLIKYHPAKEFEPGEKYQYSNTGYVLLASIAEAASGIDFIEFCTTRIFVPLQLTSTAIRTNEEKRTLATLARGHIFVKEKGRYVRADSFPSSNYTIWLGNRKGPGRISSTAEDLLKWDQSLYANQLLKKEVLDEAFEPMKLKNDSLTNYGFGWMLKTDDDLGKIVYHTGDNPGYKTIIVRMIESGKTIIMLCNNAHKNFDDIEKNIELLLRPNKTSKN